MSRKVKRKYDSDFRKRQAEQTKETILAAARRLFKSKGYEGTAIDAIAKRARVSPATVYAVFGSKREILKAMIDSARFGRPYLEAVQRVMSASSPRARLRSVSGVARSVHDGGRSELGLFQGAGLVSPEIAALETEGECRRYDSQKQVIDLLLQGGALRKGVSEQQARDILWCLTGREIYRMLVVERGWSPDDYEQWLGELLVRALL